MPGIQSEQTEPPSYRLKRNAQMGGFICKSQEEVCASLETGLFVYVRNFKAPAVKNIIRKYAR